MKALPKELELKIDEAHSWLFDGDLDKIASKARKSRTYVSKVMNKHQFNFEILEAAIEVMNENKRRLEIQPTMKIA